LGAVDTIKKKWIYSEGISKSNNEFTEINKNIVDKNLDKLLEAVEKFNKQDEPILDVNSDMKSDVKPDVKPVVTRAKSSP